MYGKIKVFLTCYGYVICIFVTDPSDPDIDETQYVFNATDVSELELNNLKIEKLTNVLDQNFDVADKQFKTKDKKLTQLTMMQRTNSAITGSSATKIRNMETAMKTQEMMLTEISVKLGKLFNEKFAMCQVTRSDLTM